MNVKRTPINQPMKTTAEFDEKTRKNFVNLSRELLQMSIVEKYKFLHEHEIPKNEKIAILDTFIDLLEKIEDYETCEGLFQLRLELLVA